MYIWLDFFQSVRVVGLWLLWDCQSCLWRSKHISAGLSRRHEAAHCKLTPPPPHQLCPGRCGRDAVPRTLCPGRRAPDAVPRTYRHTNCYMWKAVPFNIWKPPREINTLTLRQSQKGDIIHYIMCTCIIIDNTVLNTNITYTLHYIQTCTRNTHARNTHARNTHVHTYIHTRISCRISPFGGELKDFFWGGGGIA